MISKKTIKAKVGKNLPQILGETLVKNWYAAISEFVCNSYDEDAENVHIKLDVDLETLTIIDDGSGMDEKGFEHFFRLGDSHKLENPVSPLKKRNRVGKKGIAKTLLRYLGDSFSITSVSNGYKYIIDEGMVEGNVSGYVMPVSEEVNGTKITIKDLNFKIGSDGFDINRLFSRLQWDVPTKPDFNTFVNGKLVKKRGVVEYASVYNVEDNIDGNELTGRLYVHRSYSKKLDGIRIYVNGRAVGEPSLFNLSNFDSRLVGNVQGVINTDFLENIITLDRSQFQEDLRLDAVIKSVNKVLTSIVHDLDHGTNRRAYYNVDKKYKLIENSLMEAQEQLSKKLKIKYKLELSGTIKAGSVATLDTETSTIHINPRNKMFSYIKSNNRNRNKFSEIYLKRAFLIASSHAITKQPYGDSSISELITDQSEDAFKDFEDIGNTFGKFSEGKVLTPLEEIHFNPYRLYDHQEVSLMTGRPATIIRLLHTSGYLNGSEEHLFSRDDLIQALKPLEGYISCVESVDPKYAQVRLKIGGHMEFRYNNQRATSLDKTLSENPLDEFNLVNVGKNHPYYFVSINDHERFSNFVKLRKLYTENEGI